MLSLIFALISAFIVSFISFVGFAALSLQEKFLKKALIFLVSFSAGGLMGGAFFHLLPESLAEKNQPLLIFIYTLLGFCLFFILEKFLRWHHCHEKKCQHQLHLGYLNLIGDGLHNFLDGLIIISAFMVSKSLGLIVTLSIIFHEIPQEFGDFGVLLYAGFSRIKALFFNFISALTAVLGVLLGFFLINWLDWLNIILIPAAAGGFLYIAAADLIPELHKEVKTQRSIIIFIIFVLALILMYLLKFLDK